MTRTKEFPRVQSLIAKSTFGSNHYAASLSLSNPIVPALEYFLSLENVTGFSGKFKSLVEGPVGAPNRNDRIVSWAALCAEIGAISLLGQTLNAHIVGFDQVSPRASRERSNCDIVVVTNGHLVFVEVKRKAAQDRQRLPEALEKALGELELSYNISAVKLLNRKYDCLDLDTTISKIKKHAEKSYRCAEIPVPFATDDFRIYFGDGPNTSIINHLFDPDFSEDLAPYLLGPSTKSSMMPMVDQAREKGADYLFCRTTGWEDWPTVLKESFLDVTFSNGRTYFTKDDRLHGLYGVVLFSRYDDFCIINNLNEGNGSWLIT